jgi:DNA-binding GntR family transcriptional regulator
MSAIDPTGAAESSRPATVNLSGQAYNAVSELIRARRLRGGEVIVETRLAEILHISRTPLREALQRLEGEGLVVKGAGRSFVVRRVDLGEYLQSLKARELIETEVAGLAVGRIARETLAAVRAEIVALRTAAYDKDAHWRSDDNLHGMFIDNCGNEVLGRIVRELRVTTRLFEIDRLKDRLEPDSAEHLAILEAFEAADVRAARRAVQAHIRSLSRFALETVR